MILFSAVLFSFNSIIAQGPTRVEATEINIEEALISAQLQFIIEEYEKALLAYDAVLTLDPANDVAFYERGRTYAKLKREDDADKSFEQAIRINPNNEWYYLGYAAYKEELLKFPDATKIYNDLCLQFPDNADHKMTLAFTHLKAGNVNEAITALQAYQEIKGPTEESSIRIFDLYKQSGKSKDAIRALENHLSVFPASTKALLALANFQKENGDKEKAGDNYRKILSINPDHTEASLALADLQGQGTKDNDQIANLKNILKNPSMDLDLKIQKLIPYVEQYVLGSDKSLEPSLIESAEILLETHPYDAKTYAIAGDIYSETGDKKRAIQHYEKTIELKNSNYIVWEQLMYLYKETHDYKSLVNQSQRAIDLFPNKTDLLYLSALASAKMDDPDESLYLLKEYFLIVASKPADTYRGLLLKARAEAAGNDVKAAQQSVTKALSINTEAPAAHTCAAELLLETDPKESLSILHLHPDENSEEYLLALARAFAQMNRAEKAENSFAQAIQKTDSPEIREQFADYLVSQNRLSEALEQYQIAQTSLPYKRKALEQKIENTQNAQ